MKLGKLPPKPHPKTLTLAKYMTGTLPDPAAKVYREYKTPNYAKKMFGNDTIGDCTCAAVANLIILWTLHSGSAVYVPADDDVIGMYSAISGYDPKTGSNDNGAAMTDVLDYMRTTGMSGHKILAWAQIDHSILGHRMIATQLFGATYTGVQLPQSAQQQFAAGDPWELQPASNIEGGHAIIHPGYGRFGDDYVSWARWDQKASRGWSAAYIDEEYAVITEDWFDQMTQLTPGGLNLDALNSDIKLL